MCDDSDKNYDKIIDNGLKKKMLEDRFEASFHCDGKLPPEIESKWLNNIEQFEEQFHNCETIPV